MILVIFLKSDYNLQFIHVCCSMASLGVIVVVLMILMSVDNTVAQRQFNSYPCPKECSCYLRNSNKIIVDVVCKIETMSARTKFSIIQTNFTSNLYITCNSTEASSFPDNLFIGLRSFTGMRIRNCMFKYIPRNGFVGLNALHELIIEKADTLQIHTDAFQYTSYLRKISIVQSGLRQMPKICQLPFLKFLNLTDNNIGTFEESGIICQERKAMRYMTYLILTKNNIKQIGEHFATLTPNIWQITVSNNDISKIHPRAFKSLRKLGWLDLTNNTITKLPNDLLQNNTNLKLLGLGKNPIGTLPNGLLRHTGSLQVLGLSDTRMNGDIWQELKYPMNITELQLGQNNINKIDRSVLQGLKYVKHLDLRNNKISMIETNSFVGQDLLETLYLSNNEISDIKEAAFRGLKSLKRLDLSYNLISAIPKGNFVHTKAILYLNISHNNLISVPDLDAMTKMNILDLRNNRIRKFESSTFEGLHDLEGINLMFNRIEYIQNYVFTKARNLRTLHLSFNNISNIGYDAFKDMASLSWVSLDHNLIENIDLIFTPIPKLFELDLSYNKINEKIRSAMFSPSISYLDLKENRIPDIDMYAFYEYSMLRKVNLQNNRLKRLSEMALSVSPRLRNPPVFLLSGNSLLCDCRLTWLRRHIHDWPLEDQQYIIEDMALLTCNQGFKMHEATPLRDIAPEMMLCSYRDECRRDTCVCCEYQGCICRYMCPKECTCYRKAGVSNENHIMCSNRNLRSVPSHIPSIATDLYLDGNNMTDLYRARNSFVQLQNVRNLYLNNSYLYFIERGSFIGLMDLVYLYLNDNYLQKLTNGVFNGLETLVLLQLQNNNINFIGNDVFTNLPNLRYLSLANNKLSSVPESLFKTLPMLFDVKMSGNRLQCDCNQTPRLYYLMTSDGVNMSDNKHIMCDQVTDNDNNSYEIASIKLYELCPGNFTPPDSKSIVLARHKLISVIAVVLSIFIIFLVVILICMSREFLQVVCFTKCGIRICHDPRDENKIYDAYITYSRADEQFVFREIVTKLEAHPLRYKLCVHFREFPTQQTISETIYRSIEASRRTIVILSDNFLNNEWRNPQFQNANKNALKNNSDTLIVIQKGYLDRRLYSPGLKLCLKSKVYLKDTDPWFFEKLYYAMPEQRRLKNSRRPSKLRLDTSAVNTVSGAMLDDEGYETPVSVASFDPSKRFSENFPHGFDSTKRFSENFSLHSVNVYEEIDSFPRKKMLS